MFRILGCAAILVAGAAVATPAAAQSWSFGVGAGFGGPVYIGPPPVYYEAPVYGARPRVIYRQGTHSPDAVFDRLQAAGYSEFSPMARRGNRYRLHAVDPNGDLVVLEIGIFSGEIERARMLQARVSPAPPEVAPAPRRRVAARRPAPPTPAAPPAAAAPPPTPPAVAPGDAPSTLRDRLDAPAAETEAPAGEPDPLVVY